MKTIQIFLKGRNPSCGYFRQICTDFRAMENTVLFYYNNTISGLRKSPEERHNNETEVLHHVFTGISLYNRRKTQDFEAYVKVVGKGLADESFTGSDARIMVARMCPLDIGGMPRRKPRGCKDETWKRPRFMSYPTWRNPYLSYEQLDAIFKMTNNPVYRHMPSQTNQNAIKKVLTSLKSFYEARKSYVSGNGGLSGKPRYPKYIREKETTAWFTNQTAVLKDVGQNVLSFVNSKVVIPVGKIPGKYIKTEVKPCFGGYMLLVTYEDNVAEVPVPERPERIMGIDMGMDNFVAVANNLGFMPFLIKGGPIKAMNQWFNKHRAELMSRLTHGKDSTHSAKQSRTLYTMSRKRDAYLRDFFYKTAHYICRVAKNIHVQVIVVGHNKGQKDSINTGHRNNQSFVSIPFLKFLSILKYTAWKYGIACLEREESYTSKASLLDGDAIPTYKQEGGQTPVFSGKRKSRGLYEAKDGTLINADINGAGNIIRKEYPYAFDGVDMSYLYQSTMAVTYKDLYTKSNPTATAPKRAKAKTKKHKPSPKSRTANFYRWNRKTELMRTFGQSKKTHQASVKTAV